MATSLIDFLTNLANDPSTMNKFRQDPDATMQAAGLSQQDQAVIKSKDPAQIRAAIAPSAAPRVAAEVLVLVI